MMARTLDAEARAVHVREGECDTAVAAAGHVGIPIEIIEGDAADRIAEQSADPDVTIVVVGARSHRAGRRPSGHVARAVIEQLRKPVLVVPPDARLPESERFERVLIPLEGTVDSTGAIAAPLEMLAAAGVDLTVLHVFRPETAPRFWDQAGHAHQSWGTEFLARWCGQRGAHLHLRSGDVAAAILEVAAKEAADLIALGWSRSLAGERAKVVRDIVGRSDVPVLLAPVTP
jgi:nucleotide-binding universal stress UspA family protein